MKNLFLLPTDKSSFLKQNNITKKISLVNKGIDLTSYTPINIYITNDEEIKEGNWFLPQGHINPHKLKGYNKINGDLESYNGLCYDISKCKKIILTTDQDLIKDGVQAIDDEFLEWFVKNPSCEWVEVEKISLGKVEGTTMSVSKYKIIIPSEEEFKNSNNLQDSIIDSSTENNSFYLPKEKRVMVKFNDDEPMHINSIYGIGNFIISLKEGENIKFQNNGKTFELYIETI